MPEQFGLEQIFGNRRAIDRHKGLVPPIARIMKSLGQQFLAGPARPQQHHRRIGVGDALNHLCNLQHFRCTGDDMAQYITLAIAPRGKTGILLFQPVHVKGTTDNQTQFIDIHRFLVKIPGATGNRPQRTGFFAMAGSHDDLGIGLQAQYRIHGREALGGAVRVRRQSEIERHDVGFFRAQHFDRRFPVAGNDDLKIIIGPFQLLLQTRIIFNDQQLFFFRLNFVRHHAALSSAGVSPDRCLASGRISVKRLPTPSVLSTSRRPFIARANSRAS